MGKFLDELPPSDDAYFTKYKADTNKIELGETKKCKHYFKRKSGIEAECDCGVGYYVGISPEIEIKKGHIYRDSKLVI